LVTGGDGMSEKVMVKKCCWICKYFMLELVRKEYVCKKDKSPRPIFLPFSTVCEDFELKEGLK